MRLGTPESHSLLKTQQQVSAIQGTLQEIQQKLNTIEGKVDNLAASLCTSRRSWLSCWPRTRRGRRRRR